METRHRFPPIPGEKRNVVIRVVEYRGNYVGRWDTSRGCIIGDEASDPSTAAASAYQEVIQTYGTEPIQ